jgi:hypothetical protein
MIAVAATVANVAVLLALGDSLRASVIRGTRKAGWFVAIAVPAVALVWAINLGDQWATRRAGEISAWFIAQLGWSDLTALFTAQRYLSVWLRWVFVPVAVVAALAATFNRTDHEARRWLRTTWHWRTLLIATVTFVAFIVLPWRAAFWPLEGLPPTWIQPTIAGARLAVVALLIVLGFAVIVVVTAQRTAQVSQHVKQ